MRMLSQISVPDHTILSSQHHPDNPGWAADFLCTNSCKRTIHKAAREEKRGDSGEEKRGEETQERRGEQRQLPALEEDSALRWWTAPYRRAMELPTHSLEQIHPLYMGAWEQEQHTLCMGVQRCHSQHREQ